MSSLIFKNVGTRRRSCVAQRAIWHGVAQRADSYGVGRLVVAAHCRAVQHVTLFVLCAAAQMAPQHV